MPRNCKSTHIEFLLQSACLPTYLSENKIDIVVGFFVTSRRLLSGTLPAIENRNDNTITVRNTFLTARRPIPRRVDRAKYLRI